jgi:hypothetical protein
MAFKICLQFFFLTESDRVVDLSVIYTLEGPGTSMSQNMHPASEDSSSYIEETMRRTSNEHRERSLNKLTRTLGAHPLTITDDLQTSRSPIFDNFSEGDKPGTHHDHKRDSFESDSLSSPMTFAPPSIENAPHSKQTPAPPTSDVDSITTTSREDSCSASAESESSMPHLHVSTHSTSDSVSNDVHPASDPNGPVAKSDWLVPLNEVVISSRRTAPSKPQSWTGEWNRDVKDVIRDLRRL